MSLKVYVLLYWYWDGDSNLVHSYEGLYPKHEEAVDMAYSLHDERKLPNPCRIYDDEGLLNTDVPEEKPKESDGHYRAPGFWEIVPERICLYYELI